MNAIEWSVVTCALERFSELPPLSILLTLLLLV